MDKHTGGGQSMTAERPGPTGPCSLEVRPKSVSTVASDRKAKRRKRLTGSEFKDAAIDLQARGWHPIPVGRERGKTPLLGGVSGYGGIDVDDHAEYEAWARRWAGSTSGLNLASRAPLGVIGIDCDFYAGKHGRVTLAEAESRWGALPATWMTTARDDGSGIRWFRLPEECQDSEQWRAVGVLPGGDVETVQRHHRYGVMPPSVHHTGARYRVVGPDGDTCDGLPTPSSLPVLPDEWVQGLRRDGGVRQGRASATEGLVLRESLDDGPMGERTIAHLGRAVNDLAREGSRYDAMNGHVISLIREGAYGAQGVPTALRTLRSEYVRVVATARGGESVAHQEFDVAERDAGQIIAGEGPVCLETFGALEPGGLWHTDTSSPGISRESLHARGKEPADVASSWKPVDIAAALRGGNASPPSVLRRDDDKRLFYAGKVHSVHGESESGKSWLVQCAAAQVLSAGGAVLYVDFEDDAASVAGRLLLLGVDRAILTDPLRFLYLRPDESLGSAAARTEFEQVLDGSFELAVIDGVTDSMGVFGYSVKDNDDVAAWQRKVPRAIARATGAAVACVDHVSRDTEGRGRFALGGQHKLAGLDGAAFVVEMEKPFGVGMAGVASVRVGKDRPGHIRNLGGAWRKSDRTQQVADFHFDSTDPESPLWNLAVPTDAGQPTDVDTAPTSGAKAGATRPTWAMEQVSRYWESTPDTAERSTTKTTTAMCAERKANGKPERRQMWRKAIDLLVDEGYAEWVEGPRKTHEHSVLRPYRQMEDPASDNYSGQGGVLLKIRAAKDSDFDDDSDAAPGVDPARTGVGG